MRIAVALAASAIALQAGAQPPVQPQPTFRGGVNLVQLDVSVVDRDHRPARGLTVDDFAVLEDGKVQKLSAFAEVDVPEPLPAATSWLREIAPDVVSNAPVDRRLIFIVLDDASIQSDPRTLANAKDAARRVVDHLGPQDLGSVVFTLNRANTQGLTADRTRLRAAIETLSAGYRGVPGHYDQWYDASAGALERLVTSLVDETQRRKIIVYVVQGVPTDIEESTQDSIPDSPYFLYATMWKAFQQAKHANVNIYTVDACGVRVPPLPRSAHATCVPGWEPDFLATLASAAGGHAVLDRVQFEDAIAEIFRENDSYYLLGYQPVSWQPGKPRHIEVRVMRPRLEVRARDGYETPTAGDAKADAKSSPLIKAMAGARPIPDIGLRLQAAAFVRPGSKDAAFALVLNVHQVDMGGRAGATETLDFQVNVLTSTGLPRKGQQQTATVLMRPGAAGEVEYEVVTQVPLPPGRYQLRLSAHSGLQNKNGSVYVDAEMPDFVRTPLTLSGVLLTARQGPPVAPKDGIPLVPVVPTARRQFTRSDEVSAFWRIYQGGKDPPASVSVRTRIEDSAGVEVFASVERFAGERFDARRSADQQVTLPLGRLPPGEFLLATEATMSSFSARREIRFRVN